MRGLLCFVVVLVGLPALAKQIPLDSSIPDTIRQEGGRTVWVSEDVGSLRAISDHDRESLANILKNSPPVASFDDCKPYGPMRFHYSALTAEELLERAHYIARVEINGTKPGIYRGRPGELLDVSVTEVLKDSGRTAFDNGFYLFHDYARRIVESQAVCIGEPIPSGEFLIFLEHANPRTALPIYDLEASLLVSLADKTTMHGRLFDPRDEKEIPALLERFGL